MKKIGRSVFNYSYELPRAGPANGVVTEAGQEKLQAGVVKLGRHRWLLLVVHRVVQGTGLSVVPILVLVAQILQQSYTDIAVRETPATGTNPKTHG